MQELLIIKKRGDYLTLRSPQGTKAAIRPRVNPPVFSNLRKGTSMPILPRCKEVPHLQEKLQVLKRLIVIDQNTIKRWEAQEPEYYLLPAVKEQLQRNKKLLAEYGGPSLCQ